MTGGEGRRFSAPIQLTGAGDRRVSSPIQLTGARSMGLIGYNSPLGLLGLPAWMWKGYPHLIVVGLSFGIVFAMWLCIGGDDRRTRRKQR